MILYLNQQSCAREHQCSTSKKTACTVQKQSSLTTELARNEKVITLKWQQLSIYILQKVTIQANQRKDDWGDEVKMRIQIASDLVAEEGKYHRRCAQLFYLGRQLDSCVVSRQSGRPFDAVKNEAFTKLCQYIDENEE